MLLEEPPKARKFLLELSIVASESQASFKAIISPDFICRNDFSCHDYNSSLGFNSIPEQHELDKLANHGIPGAQHHKEHSTNAQLSSMASLILTNNSRCSLCFFLSRGTRTWFGEKYLTSRSNRQPTMLNSFIRDINVLVHYSSRSRPRAPQGCHCRASMQTHPAETVGFVLAIDGIQCYVLPWKDGRAYRPGIGLTCRL